MWSHVKVKVDTGALDRGALYGVGYDNFKKKVPTLINKRKSDQNILLWDLGPFINGNFWTFRVNLLNLRVDTEKHL